VPEEDQAEDEQKENNGNPLSTRQQNEKDMVLVTEQNISKYTMEDVVLPIVGHKIRMPENEEMNKIILDIMAKDNITMDHFHNSANLGATCAAGSYRKIIAIADDIAFDVIRETDQSQDILTPNYLEEADPTPELNEENGGSVSKAMRIKFNLKSSSYATMFLREVMHIPSDFESQMKLQQNQK
jgi:tRNA pseudouridine13 synthase